MHKHMKETVIRAKNYSACWIIIGADGESDEKLSKRYRTLGELAYAKSHKWNFAKVCASGFTTSENQKMRSGIGDTICSAISSCLVGFTQDIHLARLV